MSAETVRRPSSIKSEYVGFANFPNQVFRRCIKNGFDFTVMVVGQSGLGKSTFINTLFSAEINDPASKPSESCKSTVSIESKTLCLVDNDVKVYMTFVDTPGFGDAVDNSGCWEPIIKFVDSKFSDYLAEETKIERSRVLRDTRVHLCLYFIAPTGHGLREIDIAFMKALQDRVNIVPVIAKSDSLTHAELTVFKQNILRDLESNEIRVYRAPEQDISIGNSKAGPKVEDYRKRIPFAVIGSNKLEERGSRKMRVREYAWGTVEVENLAHNDFLALRDMIIRTNFVDLINVTRDVHYENFRYNQMCKGAKGNMDKDPFTQLEQERRYREEEDEAARNEKEKIFAKKVAELEQKLTEKKRFINDQDKENRRIVEEKRQVLQRLMDECSDLRRATGVTESGTSIGRHSPGDKNKKKSGTLNIFNRN